ncbi:YfhO family protein [Streptococcus merionis]|uniref:Copper ABC transporter permease n=1 Tax=Streptococcus merionis TaxID=400065 RepID=A0A239SXW9_9STRE|nr:YfhO family protein [Streptococcus merionis]SNU90375.1 copper ABC transporter permease [Streptococcus merionis]
MKRVQKRKIQNRKLFLACSLSFLIPVTVIITLLALKGIYPGSDRTILASDGFHQYAIFHTTLRNILHGDGSIFFTFTSGLGLNFYALSSYYLGSFLSPLAYFFTLETMPDALYFMTIMKFGLIGLSTFLSLQHIYCKLDNRLTLLLSSSFSLMSFSTSQLEITMWLDVFIIAPIIIWGMSRFIKEEGRGLYFTSLTLLFIQNYYFGFMMAIFLTLWYIVQLSWNFKERIKTFFDFTIVSILSAITSLIMILPAVLDLQTHGETLTQINQLQTDDSWWLDLFAKNLVGSYDTTKFGAVPMIYVGLLPLILALTFFFIKGIKKRVKLAYLTLISFLTISFYLEPLDLLWQGMHAPNMFLHRYAWLWSLLIILMAAEVLSRLNLLTWKSFVIPSLIVISGFVLTFVYRAHYEYLEPIHFILTAEFLGTYCVIALFSKKLASKQLVYSLLFFSIFELSLNAYYQISGIENEWHFPSRESYNKDLTDIVNLVDNTKLENDTFFRTERLLTHTGNDSMKFNYNGISQFSSIRNRSSSQLLDKLGFKSSGTNLNLRYQNNTLLMDMLFGIKYNLAKTMPGKYGFTMVEQSHQMQIHENSHSASLGILSTQPYQDVPLSDLSLDNQTAVINKLTGLDLTYYNHLTPVSISNLDLKAIQPAIIADSSQLQSDFASAQFEVTTDRDSQIYLSLAGLTMTNDDYNDIQIIVNQKLYNYTIDDSHPLFDLGFFTANQTLDVRLIFPNQKKITFDDFQVLALDINHFLAASEVLTHQNVHTKVSKNQVKTSYVTEKDTSIIYTLPYDKGWTATVNGKKTPIEPFQKGLMKIAVPKGKGEIVLTFVPNGLVEGSIAFVVGIALFFIYDYSKRVRKTTISSTR